MMPPFPGIRGTPPIVPELSIHVPVPAGRAHAKTHENDRGRDAPGPRRPRPAPPVSPIRPYGAVGNCLAVSGGLGSGHRVAENPCNSGATQTWVPAWPARSPQRRSSCARQPYDPARPRRDRPSSADLTNRPPASTRTKTSFNPDIPGAITTFSYGKTILTIPSPAVIPPANRPHPRPTLPEGASVLPPILAVCQGLRQGRTRFWGRGAVSGRLSTGPVASRRGSRYGLARGRPRGPPQQRAAASAATVRDLCYPRRRPPGSPAAKGLPHPRSRSGSVYPGRRTPGSPRSAGLPHPRRPCGINLCRAFYCSQYDSERSKTAGGGGWPSTASGTQARHRDPRARVA
jgi:hypothetical protein